jgi:DNA polymerase-3 subunit delta
VDYAAFVKAVERDTLPAVSLLHGSESFLLNDGLARVTRACCPDPSLVSLNRECFDARETKAEAIVRSALTLPLAGSARLVAVRESQELGQRESQPLAEYIKAPNPSTRLLLLAGEMLPANHWLLKLVPASAVVAVRPLAGRELREWLRRRAADGGFSLTEDAAQLLVQWAGEDLTTLAGELEKAALWAGAGGGRIGVEEIKAIVGEHRVREVWDLARALERRALGQALAVLEGLLDAGEEPLALLGILTREVRHTWLAKEWLRKGKSVDEIARRLRRPPGVVEAFLARAESCPTALLRRQLSRCWEVERRLKAGGVPRPELTGLVASLCEAG